MKPRSPKGSGKQECKNAAISSLKKFNITKTRIAFVVSFD